MKGALPQIGREKQYAAREGGFTYVALLFAVALVGLVTASSADSFVLAGRRNNSTHQKWVGEQYVAALRRYHAATPGGLGQYPKTITDLLLDPRFPVVRRHLREIYFDPETGASDWLIVKAADGQIIGLESRASTRRQFFVSNLSK